MVLELKKLSDDEKVRQQAEARADYESRIATAKAAGYREGEEAGISLGASAVLFSLVKDDCISSYEAADRLNISTSEFNFKYAEWLNEQ